MGDEPGSGKKPLSKMKFEDMGVMPNKGSGSAFVSPEKNTEDLKRIEEEKAAQAAKIE